jgi:excinuclease ABC subunit A
MSSRAIEVCGARTHNLKNIHCRFPHGQLTVVTGVSGSGKSSLAFDTLFAEGQRRYVESMSTYVRQFIEQMPRPDVDQIRNLPPAIALEQKNAVKNARSTVGTATEVYDHMRLLYAKVGRTICPDCHIEVKRETAEGTADWLLREAAGERIVVIAPVSLREEILRAGFTRVWLDGEAVDLESLDPARLEGRDAVEVVIDRIVVGPESATRLGQAIETAFRAGKGCAVVEVLGREPVRPSPPRHCEEPLFGDEAIPKKQGIAPAPSPGRRRFYEEMFCNNCGRAFRRPEPSLFSFYSPLGSCPKCQGFGRTTGLDMDKIIPRRDLALNDRPVAPWNTPANKPMYPYMRKCIREQGLDLPLDVPIDHMTPAQYGMLVEGNGDWIGIRGFFDWLEGRKYKVQARIQIARYRQYAPCAACGATRLTPDALNVRVDGRTIASLNAESIAELRRYFDALRLPPRDEQAAERLLMEIRSRLHYLDDVGLGYLTLNRQTRTLSGGESQRINLSAALGSGLTETLYVLDEPTVGLHPRDTDRLLRILHALRNNGNTVVVVEHDPVMLRGANRILDLGPGAGERGGQVVFEGTVEELRESKESLTAKYLFRDGRSGPASTGCQPVEAAGIEQERAPRKRREPYSFVHVRGARAHNLKNLAVAVPVGVLTCVTGVSGSGKSTLLRDTVYAGFRRLHKRESVEVGAHDALEGFGDFDDVVLVDQSPPGKSTRSNPVTYTKAYDEIRKLMAETGEARDRGVSPGMFSFNVPGGRCEKCAGTGQVTIDMHFLADVSVTCDACDGKRFKPSMLDIRYKGLNIDEVLDLTVERAMEFFHDRKKIVRALEPLRDVGLGYLRLGQNTSTLSGGEAQRLKLASYIAQRASRSHLMMLFDEPTTGLHPADIDVLMKVLHRLLDRGVTLVVIEHNLELIAQADWILDLGPEGGDAGGELVYAGPFADFLSHKTSHTARFLREHLEPQRITNRTKG